MSVVEIHLTIHNDEGDIQVDFPFDTRTDDINEVVAELAKECNLQLEEQKEVKSLIQMQIAKAQPKANGSVSKFENFEQVTADSNLADDIDEQVFNDPEYQALLERHRREIAKLEETHLKQQRALVNGTSNPINACNACDDLIVFS